MSTDAIPDYNILNAISMPMDGVVVTTGPEQFMALTITADADIKRPYREIFPKNLYEFAVMATFRPDNALGGYLFSVVNPYDTVVQLGVHLSPVVQDRWNVSLMYTDSSAVQTTQCLVAFEMDYVRDWQQIAIAVHRDTVGFYLNCDLVQNKTVQRVPLEFYFDSASTLYVGQAGQIIRGKFLVSTC